MLPLFHLPTLCCIQLKSIEFNCMQSGTSLRINQEFATWCRISGDYGVATSHAAAYFIHHRERPRGFRADMGMARPLFHAGVS